MLMKRTTGWVLLLVLTIGLVWGMGDKTEAQAELDEVLPERLEMLVYPPTAENSAQLAAVLAHTSQSDMIADAPYFHMPGTLLVYQNFETGNWEILLNTASQAKINLTNHPAADIHPRLNRGATHVVFASNRAGNFDLYLMKSDGSNLTRLTASAGDDVNPVWSPDGTKIAFESYRDGQAEIYVMNADGSNQTRLTASPDFDGMPTWSPDGQIIAFSSRRTGGYRIYTMDADTGANQIQRSDLPYSLYPAWSPDGKYIAYTADYDNDFWLEGVFLIVQNNYSQANVAIYNFSHQYLDVLVGSWSPDGAYIAVTFQIYELVQWPNGYQLQRSEINLHDFARGFQTPANTSDNYSSAPDINTTDNTPPLIRVRSLPALMPMNGAFNVAWDTVENGSGIAYHEVEYRPSNNSNWMDLWGLLPTLTQVPYQNPVTINQTIQFRVRGIDNHRNMAQWSNPVSTTFYGWYSAGNIRDNRNQPVMNVPITIVGSTLNQVRTNANGNYEVYRTSMGEHTISMSYEGQPLLAPTTLDTQNRLRLPQANLAGISNLISNSFFEDALAGWASDGLVEINEGYTGQWATTLGQVNLHECSNCAIALTQLDWPPSASSTISSFSFIPDVKGNFLFMASLYSLQGFETFYTVYSQETGQWADWQLLPIGNLQPITWITTDDGNIHMFYPLVSDDSYQNDYYYVKYSFLQGWSEPEFVISYTYPPLASIPIMLVDKQDILHIFVEKRFDYDSVLYDLRREAHGNWQQLTVLDNPPTFSWDIVQFANKDVHLFYLDGGSNQLSGIESKPYIVHKVWQQDIDNWLTLEHLYLDNSITLSMLQTLYTPIDDTFHLSNILRYNPSEGWTKSSAWEYLPYGQISKTGQLYDSSNGDYGSSNGVTLKMLKPYSYNWYEVETLPHTSTDYPSYIVLDANNNSHYLRISSNPSEILHYNPHSITALHDQTHTLAQVVTIPADMPYPTVSLMYRTVRDIPGDDTQFEVRLTNGISTTTHVLPPTAVLWKHAWFDASEWAGETVTLTLAAVQKAGDPLLRVDLDDVSLGSAAPDTWLAVEATRSAMPNETFPVTLRYGNLSPDLLAPTATLTLTLPTGLTVNSTSITPTVQTDSQLVWQLGDLPATANGTITLSVTVKGNVPLWSTITATAALRTPLAEPSWANNNQTWPLFIGHRLYLPAIFR